MESFERRMNLIKSGELAPVDTKYDPLQDLQSHSKSMKRASGETERYVPCLEGEVITDARYSYLSKTQVEELREVQRQRQQVWTCFL
jgi:hypothetical protein